MRHQVKLTFAQVLGAEIGHGIGDAAPFDGIGIGLGEIRHEALGHTGRGGQRPVGAFIEWRREDAFVFEVEPGVRFSRGVGENLSRFVVRLEWLSLFDADGLKLINHDLVAREPRLPLHEAIERLEEAHVVGNRAIEQDVDSVDKLRRRRIRRLRQGIKLHALAVGDSLG